MKRIPERGKICAFICGLNVNTGKSVWLVPIVPGVNKAKDGFGNIRIQVTDKLYIILRNLDILPVTKKTMKYFKHIL